VLLNFKAIGLRRTHMENKMVITVRRLDNSRSFRASDGLIIGEGDFEVEFPAQLPKLSDVEELVKKKLEAYAELHKNKDSHFLYFRSSHRLFGRTLSAAAVSGKLSLSQFAMLQYVINVREFDLEGERALEYANFMRGLATRMNKIPYRPIHLSRKMIPKVRIRKFIDPSTGKSSVGISVPTPAVRSLMVGRGGRNISALGTVLAGGADVHPWIEPIESD